MGITRKLPTGGGGGVDKSGLFPNLPTSYPQTYPHINKMGKALKKRRKKLVGDLDSRLMEFQRRWGPKLGPVVLVPDQVAGQARVDGFRLDLTDLLLAAQEVAVSTWQMEHMKGGKN